MNIIERMNSISEAAEARMQATKHAPGMSYAPILWMTPDEASEFLALRLELPANGQERTDAKQRITAKIAARRVSQ